MNSLSPQTDTPDVIRKIAALFKPERGPTVTASDNRTGIRPYLDETTRASVVIGVSKVLKGGEFPRSNSSN